MEKFIKDGQIAVLVSPGYGAGWSTWNNYPASVFDPDIVKAILANDITKACEIASEKYPEAYQGGMEDLIVEWIDEGTMFQIKEYDGYESIDIFGDASYLTA